MLYHFHLSDGVRRFDQLSGGSSTGDNNMLAFTTAMKPFQHLFQGQVVGVEDDIEFIQKQQLDLFITQQLQRLYPAQAGSGDILLPVLGLPSEAVTDE